jgi:hypothetical protein
MVVQQPVPPDAPQHALLLPYEKTARMMPHLQCT